MRNTACCFVLLFLFGSSLGQRSVIPDEDWGYISSTPTNTSNLFWWLYGAKNANRDKLPLVIWLQGGPGASSMMGNFQEIGQLDMDLKPRQSTWSNSANLLFLDSPVGSGWSYTTNEKYTTTDAQVVADLMNFLKAMIIRYDWLKTTPLWIFGESYGGKAAAGMGVEIVSAIKQGKLNINFKGVALGDSWMSPLECMASYGPFLESVSLIDGVSSDKLSLLAKEAQAKLASGDGQGATSVWAKQQQMISDLTGGLDFYDYMRYHYVTPSLDALMETTIRTKLKTIPSGVKYGGQSAKVFTSMSGDFMKSGVKSVEILLSEGYQVAVYAGQLDVIVNVACVNNWVEKLSWKGAANFFQAPRTLQFLQQKPIAAVKKYNNLQLWNVYDASHMVPTEAPYAALVMFNAIIASV